jgi:hypothetical protein
MKTFQAPKIIATLLISITMIAHPARAQTKIVISEQCGRPTSEYTIQVGDHPGHMFRIEQSTCTPGAPLDIGGVAVKQHLVTGFIEIDAAQGAGDDQWYHIFTLTNGDSVYARSQGKATFEGARFKASSAKWNFTSGTGKFQAITGSGSYTCHPAAGGWACEAQGTYQLP